MKYEIQKLRSVKLKGNQITIAHKSKVYRLKIGDKISLIPLKDLTKDMINSMKVRNGGPDWTPMMKGLLIHKKRYVIDAINVSKQWFHLNDGFWWTVKFIDIYELIKATNQILHPPMNDRFIHDAF